MIVKKRRKFEPGFKRQLVEQIEAGAISLSEAARVHEISPTVIQYWRKKYHDGQLHEGPTKREKELERDIKDLKAKVGELTMEIDFLKKIEDYSRRQKKLNTSVITGLNIAQFKKGAGK